LQSVDEVDGTLGISVTPITCKPPISKHCFYLMIS